jgi:hypothetical protein
MTLNEERMNAIFFRQSIMQSTFYAKITLRHIFSVILNSLERFSICLAHLHHCKGGFLMKAKLLTVASCFCILVCHFAFAYPTYSKNYRLTCNNCACDDDYTTCGSSCDSCGDSSDYYQTSYTDMWYYNSRTPLVFQTSCSCTDPNYPSNPCLNCGEFCHAFGNIGGRNYSDIYCCGA